MAELPSALIPLTEAPPSINLIKRALLSFHALLMPEPDERDAVAHAFHGLPYPGIAPQAGDYFPIGKKPNYDRDYAAVHRALAPARKAGVIAQYRDPLLTPNAKGGVNLVIKSPGVVLPVFTRSNFGDADLMLAASRGAHEPNDPADWQALAPDGRIAEFLGRAVAPQERLVIARLAMARKLVPNAIRHDATILTEDPGVAEMARILQSRELGDPTEPSADNVHPTFATIESLVYNEFIPQKSLNLLSVQDIVRMRTRAWGKEGAARMRLYRMVARLAEECRDSVALRTRVRAEMDAYRNAAADLAGERQKVGWRGAATLVAGATLPMLGNVAGAVSTALAHALVNPTGTLIATVGTVGALAIAVGPAASDYWAKRKKFENSAGFALLSPYEPFAK